MGIGDEQGRMVRVKDPPKLSKCTICQLELKITKTNTELTQHAQSKHGKPLDECFPGATEAAEELKAAVGKGGNADNSQGQNGGLTKAQKKKKTEAAMDDLLNAGLSSGKKKGK